MPSGFALTVWAANNFVASKDRDDKSLYETLKKIESSIFFGVSCICPKEPGDELTGNLDSDQKGKFKNALNDFIKDAESAINSNNQLKASKLWQKHLGSRFKDGADEDVDKKEAELRVMADAVKSGVAKTSSISGSIQKDEGVSNQKHRNYGG